MTPEQQKLADEKYAQEERIRVARERMGGARFKGLPKEEWDTKKMTDREIAGMYSDARRPGALPPNWKKATEKEQDIMLENANDRLKPGEKLFTKYTLGLKVDRDPTSIPFLLKSKDTVNLPSPKTRSELDKLPSGAKFIASDGSLRIKK